MTDPFVHLHVASGYSLKHGASHPRQLVERAAEHGMDTLALTDRDGAYGIVKFAQACERFGIRPVFGVDLAFRPLGSGGGGVHLSGRKTPARGGAFRRELPRVTFLARTGRGWAQLCRLVSATHLAGERGVPVSSLELVREHVTDGVAVLLGPQSELGQALLRRRPDEAAHHLRTWRDAQ